jgi:hypothetical protein
MLALFILAGCAAKGPGPLYLWDTFPRQQYATLLKEGADPLEQIRLLETHAEKARAAGSALPPGFRAHLGMLYGESGNAQRARELWQAEIVAFPESAPFMDRLLKRLDGATPVSSKDKPA